MEQCHACGREFTRVSMHYAKSECSYPEIPNHLKERAIGELAGDGSIKGVWKQNATGYLCVRMVEERGKKYLQDLNRNFGSFSKGEIREEKTGPGFGSDKIYCFSTKTHPFFTKLAKKWYKERGGKRFPSGLKLSRTFMKAWYCGDGCLAKFKDSPAVNIQIGVCSEYDNPGVLEKLFKPTNFKPTISKRVGHNDRKRLTLIFNSKQTLRLLRYMGNPAPGYGYKWDHPDLSPEEKAEQPFC